MTDFNNIIRRYFHLVASVAPMKRRKLNPEGESFETTKTMNTMARSTFNDMPRETWHEIASHLASSDKAALALTCKSSLTCFGAEVVRNLNLPSERVERLKLLFRFHDQFPKHYLCAECCMYHLTSNQWKYEASDIALNKEIPQLKWSLMASIAQDLREAKCTRKEAAKRVGEGVTFALVQDHLLIYVGYGASLTVKILQQGTCKDSQYRGCEHNPNSITLKKEVEKAIAAAPRPWELSKAYNHQSSVFRCPYCPTEFHLYSVPIKEETFIPQTGARFKLVLIRVSDLGRVVSPHDRNWAALSRSRYAGISETTPYDIESIDSLTKQFYAAKGWPEVFDSALLPLLN